MSLTGLNSAYKPKCAGLSNQNVQAYQTKMCRLIKPIADTRAPSRGPSYQTEFRGDTEV
jgi:hypothetical protein